MSGGGGHSGPTSSLAIPLLRPLGKFLSWGKEKVQKSLEHGRSSAGKLPDAISNIRKKVRYGIGKLVRGVMSEDLTSSLDDASATIGGKIASGIHFVRTKIFGEKDDEHGHGKPLQEQERDATGKLAKPEELPAEVHHGEKGILASLEDFFKTMSEGKKGREIPAPESEEELSWREKRLEDDFGLIVKKVTSSIIPERPPYHEVIIRGILQRINARRKRPLTRIPRLEKLAEHDAASLLENPTRSALYMNLFPLLDVNPVGIPKQEDHHEDKGLAAQESHAQGEGDAHGGGHGEEASLLEKLQKAQQRRAEGIYFHPKPFVFEEKDEGRFPGADPEKIFHLYEDQIGNIPEDANGAGIGIIEKGGKLAVSMVFAREEEIPEETQAEYSAEIIDFSAEFWKKEIGKINPRYLDPKESTAIGELLRRPEYQEAAKIKTLYDYARIVSEVEKKSKDGYKIEFTSLRAYGGNLPPHIPFFEVQLSKSGELMKLVFTPGKQSIKEQRAAGLDPEDITASEFLAKLIPSLQQEENPILERGKNIAMPEKQREGGTVKELEEFLKKKKVA